MGLGGALLGGTIIGAISSDRASSRAADTVQDANLLAEQRIRESSEAARAAAIPLFGAAEQNALAGIQAALGTFGQTIPEQARLSQAGNVQAQQQLLAGLPQIQNAILGNQVDFGALQPTQLQQPNFDIFNQQLPPNISIEQALGGLFGSGQPPSGAASPIEGNQAAAAPFPFGGGNPVLFNPIGGGAGDGIGGGSSNIPLNFGISAPISPQLEQFAFGNLFNAER